jgi:hypothetical protein
VSNRCFRLRPLTLVDQSDLEEIVRQQLIPGIIIVPAFFECSPSNKSFLSNSTFVQDRQKVQQPNKLGVKSKQTEQNQMKKCVRLVNQ